ncbi:zinc finger MYM-type protein 1-like [Daktulosphaira vitifoliae]|uniref:zinc finger MYM-type protein 1-like n=1 Tax=Daktulosphaira vitifoliae TaxID=58002 RepID=UPI0021A9E498|nr:zinc finger MYM-type protein 1-like [Daktulosphaira vitifoliae]
MIIFEACSDPALWSINEDLINYVCFHGFTQDLSIINFSKSKRSFLRTVKGIKKTINRSCKISYFQGTLKNGEKFRREFLAYSETKGVLFCYPCLLFSCKSSFGSTGFSLWKKADEKIQEHLNSSTHRSNILKMKLRGVTLNRIDSGLANQVERERLYWIQILKRVVAVVKKLASRGLALRGDTSKLGFKNNGNFLMAIELLSEFDPFMAEHLKQYGNPGRGFTSYLSCNIYEEIIKIMAEKVLSTIIQEINDAHYFSISVDSTPDISHIDQLSLCIRYVNSDGSPVERFICFLDHIGHKAENIAEAVFTILKTYKLNIANLRGQSYDNASNMAGAYSGLQTRIKAVNPMAKFVPCAAHSLNLVGMNSVSCCIEAVKFFNLLQIIYNFFSASTHRWAILKSTVKSLSGTRWSAREDACKSLNENWSSIMNASNIIECDANEKPNTRFETKCIKKKLDTLEIGFLSIFWGNILQRFNAVILEIFKNATKLQKEFEIDLEPSFVNECLHLRGHLKSLSDGIPKTIQEICMFIRQKNLQSIYPYIDIALRILLCTPISNCSTERSFSTLKRIKSYLRSSTFEDRLNNLALLSIEGELTSKINYDEAMNGAKGRLK